jgi:hypothetical protein
MEDEVRRRTELTLKKSPTRIPALGGWLPILWILWAPGISAKEASK